MGQLLDVINVEVLPDYKLVLTFENKEVRLFSMIQYMDLKPYNKLKGPHLFRLAKVEYGTVVWPGEIDIAPETLYIESIPYQNINFPGTLQATA
jgi:hypothetical protein